MIAPKTRRKILAALVSSCLLLATACQTKIPVDPNGVTVPETIISEEPTTEGSVLSETLETTVPEKTTTVAEVTTSETTLAPSVTPTPEPTVTAAPTATPVPTKAPTPKPTKAPVETTAAPPPTTAAPTDPPPPTTTAARYTENPDNIRALIVQYCVDNNLWFPGEEVNGSGSKSYELGYYYSDQLYVDAFINGKIKGDFEIVSVSCWIEDGYINISYEKSFFPTPAPTA